MGLVRRVCWVAGWAWLAGGILACSGGSRAPVDAPPQTAGISKVHKARCGACHLRVEPGERSRAELETAFTRHRRRVHLSEVEWGEMVDYLAVK